MDPGQVKKRIEVAFKLLNRETILIEQFKALKDFIAGLNPKIDRVLDSCSKALATVEKLQRGEIIELSAENLPEKTEEEKRRKKALLLFLKNWKQLKSEVKRVKGELENMGSQGKIQTSEKIIAYAKGPFGIITLAAVLISGFILYQTNNNLKGKQLISPTSQVSEKSKIQAIEFQGKKIPLTEVIVGTGSDCDNPHYHANDHISAKALDGSIVQDPGGCGFGRVKDVSVIEIK